ncbi:MAG: GGDEF domain-containing protein [Pseudomonadota bacterium]
MTSILASPSRVDPNGKDPRGKNEVRALQKPLSEAQETAILNQLSDAVAIVQMDARAEIHFANPAFLDLVETDQAGLAENGLEAYFTRVAFSGLYDSLEQAHAVGERREIQITFRQRKVARQLRVTMTPHRGAHMVICITDVTNLANRAHYLEDRAARLIDHAHGLETSRRALEEELVALQAQMATMQRTLHYDTVSGLLNRRHFLERGAAEFQRAQRYGHTLALVLLSIQGYRPILQEHGEKAADEAVSSVSDLCQIVWRAGTDIGGRTADDEFAVLLPETNLAGALHFVERIRNHVADTPLRLQQGPVRFGLLASVDVAMEEDTAFIEMMRRAQDGRTVGPVG